MEIDEYVMKEDEDAEAKGNGAGLSDRTLDQICGHAPVRQEVGMDPSQECVRYIVTCTRLISRASIGFQWPKVEKKEVGKGALTSEMHPLQSFHTACLCPRKLKAI